MRLPIPTTREVHGAFYVAAICAFAFTITGCWAIVHKVSQSDSILRVAVSNADQVQRLSDQLDAQGKQLDALKRQAAADARLAAKNARAARIAVRQNRALLAYLRSLGIDVPETIAPRGGGGGPSAPKGRGPRGPQSSPTVPASPTPTPTPGPTPSPGVLDPVCGLLPGLCR